MGLKAKSAIVTGLAMLLFVFTCSPAAADSRSTTINVSCTIVPVLEISIPVKAVEKSSFEFRSNGVNVRTNLGADYRMTHTLVSTSQGLTRLYSVTAL